MNSSKKLIVNADDFGQSEGINEGIITAFEKGILTSTSFMTRYPASFKAADYARNHPGLGVGLHLDFGEWAYQNEKWELVYEVVDIGDIEKTKQEITNQLERFYALIGRKPTHIDSHQHSHRRSEVLPIVIKLAESLNITLRGYSNQVEYCGDFYGQTDEGFPCPEFISVPALETILNAIPFGITELACHPASKPDLQTMYLKEREIELNTLCDPRIRKKIEEENIELCSFEGIPF